MKKINLRKYYPHYTNDCFVEVPDEIADLIVELERQEIAYQRRKYRYNAHFSLDAGDGIESAAIYKPITPEEALEAAEDMDMLHTALTALPETQRRRIYACYFLGLNQGTIARLEKVHISSVRVTMAKGLARIKRKLKNFDNTLVKKP